MPAHTLNHFDLRLFDFQVNGFGGIDFQRENLTRRDWETAVSALHRHGTGQIFATLITDDVDALSRKLEGMERMRTEFPSMADTVVGYHLEGPWLSPEPGYHGAHPAGLMRSPAVKDFQRLQAAANGRIRLVTLAPEIPGAIEMIQHLTANQVHVSLGHTNASEKHIDQAIRAGARFCTHLGNATPLELARHDNIIQRLLSRDELIACFIPDGIHLPPFVLRNFYRAKPPHKVLFTTDAMAGAAATPGKYSLGRLEVEVADNGIARNPSGKGLAGSTLTPDEGVLRTAYFLGLSVKDTERLWSDAPKHAFGLNPVPSTNP